MFRGMPTAGDSWVNAQDTKLTIRFIFPGCWAPILATILEPWIPIMPMGIQQFGACEKCHTENARI